MLPRCLSKFRTIRSLSHPISQLRDFTRFGGKTSNRLMDRGPEPCFNIKMPSYQYRKSHCWDRTAIWSSYLHHVNSYSGTMTCLYWISPWVWVITCYISNSQDSMLYHVILKCDWVSVLLLFSLNCKRICSGYCYLLWPLLLTWFNFNPSMDK